MGFNCGIVGLPNVGKSTLFNALTQTECAEVMNYPFCTIEPNVGKIGVPDYRLNTIAKIASSQKIIPTQLEVVDIAGLVKGASTGEGLGNQFLGHIRSTEAILHVVRCFDNNDVVHVHGNVDPIRDIEIIETELMLADIDTLCRREKALVKKHTANLQQEKDLTCKLLKHIENGNLANSLEMSKEERLMAKDFNLITTKPVLYVCNVSEEDVSIGNKFTEKVAAFSKFRNFGHVVVSAAIESEIAVMTDQSEKQEFIASLGLRESGLDRIVSNGYNLLDLITFFTVGPKEAHAWTTKSRATAPVAAGEIHTDFERGFICAETISYDDYVKFNGESGAKSAGKMRLEGREYIVTDGDIFHFRFNV